MKHFAISIIYYLRPSFTFVLVFVVHGDGSRLSLTSGPIVHLSDNIRVWRDDIFLLTHVACSVMLKLHNIGCIIRKMSQMPLPVEISYYRSVSCSSRMRVTYTVALAPG
jgi:hypothetical protein